MCEQAANPDPSQHKCPECGKTTRITNRASNEVAFPFGLSAKLTFILTIAGLVIFLSPPAQRVLGMSWFEQFQTSTPATSGIVRTLQPPQTLSAYSTLTDSDRSVLLNAFYDELERIEPLTHNGRVRLASMPPNGRHDRQRTWGLWCRGLDHTELLGLSDIRDPESLDSSAHDQNPESLSLWPYGYRRLHSSRNGALRTYTQLDYVQIAQVLAACWLVTWLLVHLLARFGIANKNTALFLILLLSLLGMYIIAAWKLPTEYKGTLSTSSPTNTTSWLCISDFLSELDHARSATDPTSTTLSNAITNLASMEPDKDLLLGYQIDWGRTQQYDFWNLSIGPWLDVISCDTMQSVDTNGLIIPSPPDTVGHLDLSQWSRQQFTLGWTGSKAQSTIRFEPLAWMLIATVTLWYWKLAHRIAGWMTRRRDRFRARKNQCIFCAYPLSPEAVAARSSTHDS